MDGAPLGMHDPLPEGNDRRDKRHEGHERGRWEMSTTVLTAGSITVDPHGLPERSCDP